MSVPPLSKAKVAKQAQLQDLLNFMVQSGPPYSRKETRMLIPKMSAPLTKFIRTLEGLLVVGSNIALVVVPIVTNSLSATNAAKYAVILNGTTVLARSLLKAVASLNAPAVPPAAPPRMPS